MPSTRESRFGQSSIYAEATCNAEDIFYEGSDDDHYENATVKRARYESAGRQFLDGETPLILSAALKGPFEEATGWQNPWASRNITIKSMRAAPKTAFQSSVDSKKATKGGPLPVGIDSECPLPSPQSLKQASIEPHAFLEEEDLNRVQAWRESILAEDAPQTGSDRTHDERMLTGHRKANNPDWLRTGPSKKRKAVKSTMDSDDSPSKRQRRITTATAATTDIANDLTCDVNALHRSAPERLTSAPLRTPSKRGCVRSREDHDELGAGAGSPKQRASPSRGSAPITSPVKRLSPRRAVRGPGETGAKESEDELAQDKLADIKAAATLSSPVSLRKENNRDVHLKQAEANRPSSPTSRLPVSTLGTEHAAILSHKEMHTSPSTVSSSYMADVDETTDAAEVASMFDLGTPQKLKTRPEDTPKHKSASELDAAGEKNQNQQSPSAMANHLELELDSWSGLSESAEDGEALDMDIGSPTGNNTPNSEDNTSGSDDLSDISEPSLTRSSIEYIHSHRVDEVEGNDGVAATSGNSLPLESHDVSHNSNEIIPQINDPRLEVAENAETQSDMVMEDCDETNPTNVLPVSPSQYNGMEVNTTVPESVGNTPIGQPNQIDEMYYPGADVIDGTCEAGQTGDKVASNVGCVPVTGSTEVATADSASSFSFTSMFKRFVSSGSWSKSQTEDNEQAQRDDVQRHEDIDTELVKDQDQDISEQNTREIVLGQNEQKNAEAMSPPLVSEAIEQDQEISTQQSPWSKSQNTQTFGLGIDYTKACKEVSHDTNEDSIEKGSSPMDVLPPSIGVPQNQAAVAPASNPEKPVGHIPELVPAVASSIARPSTPEAHFPARPFSAFMTPSPERRVRSTIFAQSKLSNGRLPDTQSILASALKNPWSSSKPSRRVSWAPLPHEETVDSPCTRQEYTARELRGPMERAASPPPSTELKDLPTAGDVEFHHHFQAVAKRAQDAPKRLAQDMTWDAVDGSASFSRENTMPLIGGIAQPNTATVPYEPDLGVGGGWSQTDDGADLTAQVFNDLEDILRPWDLDAELEQVTEGF